MHISAFVLVLFAAGAVAHPSYSDGNMGRSIRVKNVERSIFRDQAFVKRGDGDGDACVKECSSASDTAGINAISTCTGDTACYCAKVEALSTTCMTCWVSIANETPAEFIAACEEETSSSVSGTGGPAAASSTIQSAASTIGAQVTSASASLAQASATSTAAAGGPVSSPAAQATTSAAASSPSPSPSTKSGGVKTMSVSLAVVGGGISVLVGVLLA